MNAKSKPKKKRPKMFGNKVFPESAYRNESDLVYHLSTNRRFWHDFRIRLTPNSWVTMVLATSAFNRDPTGSRPVPGFDVSEL